MHRVRYKSSNTQVLERFLIPIKLKHLTEAASKFTVTSKHTKIAEQRFRNSDASRIGARLSFCVLMQLHLFGCASYYFRVFMKT